MRIRKSNIRKALAVLLVLLLVVASFKVWSFLDPEEVEAGWWNDNWSYRKRTPISKTVASQNDVYIAFDGTDVLDTSDTAKFQGDCGDIRFTTEGGNLLKYYINSFCGTSSTDIDVFFETIPLGDQNIYMYYGNPSAPDGFEVSGFTTEATNYSIGTVDSEEVGPGPIAYWKFDENQGTSAQDTSGNGNTGTLGGDGAGPDVPKWLPGKYSSGLKFDGSDDFVDMGDLSIVDFGTNDFTFSHWIKLDDLTIPAITIGKDNTSQRQLNFFVNQDVNGNAQAGRVGFGFFKSCSTGLKWQETGNNAVDTDWHILTAVRRNGLLEIYIDGVLQSTTGTNSSGSDSMSACSSDLLVGARELSGDEDYYSGLVDQVLIYGYARTPAQIAWDYNQGGPVGWWKFDECQGTVAHDSSGNGNNGTIDADLGGDHTSVGTCSSGVGSEMWNDGTSGKHNASLDFDGNDDYVSIPNNSEIDFNEGLAEEFTISTWVYANSDGEADLGAIFHKSSTGFSVENSCRVENESAGFVDLDCRIALTTSPAIIDSIPKAFALNTWHHFALTYVDDSDDEVTVYIDGKNRGW